MKLTSTTVEAPRPDDPPGAIYSFMLEGEQGADDLPQSVSVGVVAVAEGPREEQRRGALAAAAALLREAAEALEAER